MTKRIVSFKILFCPWCGEKLIVVPHVQDEGFVAKCRDLQCGYLRSQTYGYKDLPSKDLKVMS